MCGASILNQLTFMGGFIIPTKEIRVHPDFNPFTFENDIAIVTFETVSKSQKIEF